MLINKPGFHTPLTVKEIVDAIHRKQYLLPAIQREFVWAPDQIIRLFDSIMRDYPIGSFLFWNVNERTVKIIDFYEFIRNYHERDRKHNPKASISGEKALTSILDGQQRLTALYIALKGTYAQKIPRKRWDNDEAFPEKKLYLNLLNFSKEFDLEYDFQFLTEEEAKNSNSEYFWFEIGKVLEFENDLVDINNFLRKFKLVQNENADSILIKLFQVIVKKNLINYYLETSQDLNKVLNIFIRVNRGGTQLSYSDLLLSIATAKWKTKDARKEINSFVDNLNNIGENFLFTKDFVLKSSLVLSDLKDIAFKVENFNSTNMEKIEENWNKIRKSLRISIELISEFGFNYQNLTSSNAIIPIAYYIMKKGNPNNFLISTDFKKDRNLIKKWFTISLIKRAFSGSPDNVLRPIRNIIDENTGTFPLTLIIEHFKPSNRSLVFTDDELEGLLTYKYNQKHTFSILSLLYPWLDYGNVFHKDHIFPKSFFTKRKLKKRGYGDSKIDSYMESCDYIGNLQLLRGHFNESKGSKDFAQWLNKTFSDNKEKSSYMERHYIPQDISVDFDNFEEFIEERNILLKDKLKELLQI